MLSLTVFLYQWKRFFWKSKNIKKFGTRISPVAHHKSSEKKKMISL